MPGAREIYERMKQGWLSGEDGFPEDLCADDIVVETPFAPAGSPTRVEGREQWLAVAQAGGAARPGRGGAGDDLAVHDTSDPDVIVVEHELTGTLTTTGTRASATFVGVLHVRDGQVARWREYQNVPAIAAALSA